MTIGKIKETDGFPWISLGSQKPETPPLVQQLGTPPIAGIFPSAEVDLGQGGGQSGGGQQQEPPLRLSPAPSEPENAPSFPLPTPAIDPKVGTRLNTVG